MQYCVRTGYQWGCIPGHKIGDVRSWLHSYVGQPWQHWQAASDGGALVLKFNSDQHAVEFSLRHL